MAFRLGEVVAMKEIYLRYMLSTDGFHRLNKMTVVVF